MEKPKLEDIPAGAIREIYSKYYDNIVSGMKDFVVAGGQWSNPPTAEQMVSVRNEGDIINMVGWKDQNSSVVIGIFYRMYHARNILSQRKVVRFSADKELTKLVFSQAQKFNGNDKFTHAEHMVFVASVIFSACVACLVAIGLFPKDLDVKKFSTGGTVL